MPTIEARPSLHGIELRSPSRGPRSRERLNQLGHRPVAAPPERPADRNPATVAPEQPRMVDLLAGIGGFHLAFETIGARCVFACENNPTARRAYEINFATRSPELFAADAFAGDIGELDARKVPDHDVLTAGFPCQPFSFAEKRRGFGDQRGRGFFDIARILKAKRPAAFFLENVKGLVGHDRGRTMTAIRAVLTEDLGYSLHTAVVRACDFELPQLRPRLFMVGFRNRRTEFAFPEPVPLTTSLGEVLGGQCERPVSRTLMASGYDKPHGQRFDWAHYLVDGRVHRLTPREALTLQGFPADFRLPESYSAAMRMIGNSVAVPAVAATARQIALILGFAVPATTTTSKGAGK